MRPGHPGGHRQEPPWTVWGGCGLTGLWAWPLPSQPRPLHAPPQTDTGTSRQGGGRGVRRGHWGRCSDAMGRVQTQSDGQTDRQTGLYLRSSVSRRGGVGGIRHHECPRKAGRVGKMPRGEGPAGTESWPTRPPPKLPYLPVSIHPRILPLLCGSRLRPCCCRAVTSLGPVPAMSLSLPPPLLGGQLSSWELQHTVCFLGPAALTFAHDL